MNVLEKILEEIEGKMILVATSKEHYNQPQNGKYVEEVITIKDAENIIRSHMDDVPKCGECSRRKWYQIGYEDGKKNDGWIPASEKLPEVGKMAKVTVHSSEWIGDYYSDWVPEEEKTYHPEERNVYDGYIDRVGMWKFYDGAGSFNACDKEFGTDKGTVYDVVTAWMPKEQIEPYKEE